MAGAEGLEPPDDFTRTQAFEARPLLPFRYTPMEEKTGFEPANHF